MGPDETTRRRSDKDASSSQAMVPLSPVARFNRVQPPRSIPIPKSRLVLFSLAAPGHFSIAPGRHGQTVDEETHVEGEIGLVAAVPKLPCY